LYTLKKDDLKYLLNNWAKEFEVFAPQTEDGQVMLLPFEENEFTMDYINFAFPVKEYLFKQKEVLFNWEKDKGSVKVEVPNNPSPKRKIFFGVRACDAYGIAYMDKFFLNGFRDKFYERKREEAFIAAVNCTKAGENCFCPSTGTGPFAAVGYDVLFTPLENVYLVEVGSEKGRELVEASKGLLAECGEEFLKDKEAVEKEALGTFKTKIDSEDVRKLLGVNYSNPIWQDVANSCVGCTGCTSVCPTCTCFNVVEESTGENRGCRVRYWDSCQNDSFTRNAGEHNPRTREIRVKYRIYDKLKYIEDNFGMKGCTGCGRCIGVCPAGINVVKIVNHLAEQNSNAEKVGGE
jgi:ferredoxin